MDDLICAPTGSAAARPSADRAITVNGPCGTQVEIKRTTGGFCATTHLVRKGVFRMLAYVTCEVPPRVSVGSDICVWFGSCALDLKSTADAERVASAFGLTIERREV